MAGMHVFNECVTWANSQITEKKKTINKSNFTNDSIEHCKK